MSKRAERRAERKRVLRNWKKRLTRWIRPGSSLDGSEWVEEQALRRVNTGTLCSCYVCQGSAYERKDTKHDTERELKLAQKEMGSDE